MQYVDKYAEIHDWLKRHFGKANVCEFCFVIGAKKYEYCLRKGFKYEKRKESFIQLCTGCHRKYDWTPEKSKQWSNTTKERWDKGLMDSTIRRGFKLSSKHIESIRQSKLGKNNPAKRLEVRKKISETVKRLHQQGVYKKILI